MNKLTPAGVGSNSYCQTHNSKKERISKSEIRSFFILLKKANAFIFSYPALEVHPPFFQSVAFSHTHQN